MTNAKKDGRFRMIFYLLLIVALFFAFKYLADLLLPFIIGFLFAMLIRSFVRFVENVTGMNSKISAGICTLVCYILIFSAIFFIARALISEIIHFFDNLPRIYETNISPLIHRFELYLSDINGQNSEFEKMIASFLANAEDEIVDIIKTFSGNAAEKIGQILLKIPEIFVTITVTIVASFFISIDYDAIKKVLVSHIENNAKYRVGKIKEVFFDAVGKICASYLLIFLITFAELAAGLFLLKVKYALVISLIIAIADIFPVIGTGTILVPWSVIELLNGNKPLAIGLLAIFLIISIVRNIIEPKLIGKNSGIHPVATMIAMYVGLKIGGVLCAILLPFTLIVIKHLKDKGELSECSSSAW